LLAVMKMIEDMDGDGVVGDENVRRELISIYTAHGFNLETRNNKWFRYKYKSGCVPLQLTRYM
jgi:hypothetical protein